MAEENKEVVEETTEQQVEQQVEQPVEEVVEEKIENKVDESKFESAGDPDVIKVDFSNPPLKEEKVDEPKENKVEDEQVVEEVVEDDVVIEDVTNEVAAVEEEVEEAVAEAEATGKPLPENIQKLVDFIEDTGGDINDYVNLNKDISKMDDSEALDEYYRATKSHLSPEERSFLLEDSFGINEDVDDERTIRKKKIALKEQVAEAKAHLDRQKSKYYEDIKAGSKLTEEQQKAVNFFNRYNKNEEEQTKISNASKKRFLQKTDKVFNDKFKGFDYEVGDKKFRFNIKDINKTKTAQSDIGNFVNKFVGEDSNIKDAEGYHKSLFAAMNPDAIANHFYEQGRADAIKSQIAKDKNINTNSRQTHGETSVGGVKYRVLGDNSNDFKYKIKSKNKK